jgi:hypothetical protein
MPSLRITALLLMAALWILFVDGTQFDEMIAGIGVFLLSGVLLYQGGELRLWCLILPADLDQGGRMSWYVFTGVYEIVAIFRRDLFQILNAQSAGTVIKAIEYQKT